MGRSGVGRVSPKGVTRRVGPEVLGRTAEYPRIKSGVFRPTRCAYLAARSVAGLPLSLPETTGVPHPMPGGVLAELAKKAA